MLVVVVPSDVWPHALCVMLETYHYHEDCLMSVTQIVRAGHESTRPQRGQLVTVKCCGRLDDGTEIDRHDDLKLVLGDLDFIDGESVL